MNINHWNEIEKRIWKQFSRDHNSGWIWQSLKEDYSAVSINYETFDLTKLITPKENLWFLFNETVNEKTKFWIYEGTVIGFNKVFGEATGIDEVIIVSKKHEWILIINHHDNLIGTGKIKDKIEKIKNNRKE